MQSDGRSRVIGSKQNTLGMNPHYRGGASADRFCMSQAGPALHLPCCFRCLEADLHCKWALHAMMPVVSGHHSQAAASLLVWRPPPTPGAPRVGDL
jgi:hypothetical protein